MAGYVALTILIIAAISMTQGLINQGSGVERILYVKISASSGAPKMNRPYTLVLCPPLSIRLISLVFYFRAAAPNRFSTRSSREIHLHTSILTHASGTIQLLLYMFLPHARARSRGLSLTQEFSRHQSVSIGNDRSPTAFLRETNRRTE